MSITDSELRGIVLDIFYRKRRENEYFHCSSLHAQCQLPAGCTIVDFQRICDQLVENGLLCLQQVSEKLARFLIPGLKISACGVDVIEGNTQSPISIHINHMDQSIHYALTNSHNNQMGDGNVQGSNNVLNSNVTIREIAEAIEKAAGSADEKAEARGLLNKLISHPLVTAAFNALASAVLKSQTT